MPKTSLATLSFFLAVACGAAQPAFGAAGQVQQEYLKTQESLAADQLKPAVTSARKVASHAQAEVKNSAGDERALYGKIASSAERLSKTTGIETARTEFKALSDLMIELSKKHPSEGVKIMQCTMYPGSWIQKKGETRNPYYGKQMLTCGEPVK
ncbi:MAG: hypothetical protein A2Z97_10340 [Bdellovibrionales bacterium GWB1_52_6]|nr:MAG: hypothetical protein A2Z97_10340 [Bdellovibrionales bacterium GWB1_52_6]OFZ03344.1 MAG: hypothetical protein A2X97_05215 [Bdellovibrionales bacterium GWA1_52_35]